MGSQSDWPVMKSASEMLDSFGVDHEVRVISAHRAPDTLAEYCETARDRGLKVLITGAGLAAALPGATAAKTPLPVLGVPLEANALGGLDSMLSMVQMPPGIPVGTLAVGKPGAKNAAILAVSILALADDRLRDALDDFRAKQTAQVVSLPDPREA